MKPLLPSHLRPTAKPDAEPHHDWLLGVKALAEFFGFDHNKPEDKKKLYRLKHRKKNPAPIHNVPVFGLSGRRSELKAWLDEFALA
jgi:hypothetical protein